jgi:hypothetical protein
LFVIREFREAIINETVDDFADLILRPDS